MAWNDVTRRKYQRNDGRYSSDTTDEEWMCFGVEKGPRWRGDRRAKLAL